MWLHQPVCRKSADRRCGIRLYRPVGIAAHCRLCRPHPILHVERETGNSAAPSIRAVRERETRLAFQRVIANSTLVFARDQKSYEYAVELSPHSTKIERAPDITLFYPDRPDGLLETSSNYVCIVPNVRMLDQGKDDWGANYESYLIAAAQEILDQKLRVCVVVHDASGADSEIAHRIVEQVKSPRVTIIEEQDPFVLKRTIGGSRLLIGSRYHALIAAFSQQVPSVCLGWSHKYETLFEDFGCKELLVQPETPGKAVREVVADVVQEDVNLSYRRKIAGRLRPMHAANREMWRRRCARRCP